MKTREMLWIVGCFSPFILLFLIVGIQRIITGIQNIKNKIQKQKLFNKLNADSKFTDVFKDQGLKKVVINSILNCFKSCPKRITVTTHECQHCTDCDCEKGEKNEADEIASTC